MDKVITIGKRLLPVEHIAFVEPYDPATNPKLQTSRAYQARIVLINRDRRLTKVDNSLPSRPSSDKFMSSLKM